MRKHPAHGREVIENAERAAGVRDDFTLQIAKDIVYTHHERWDGTGYPQGLQRRAASRSPAASWRWWTSTTRSARARCTTRRCRNEEAVDVHPRRQGHALRSRLSSTRSSKSPRCCITCRSCQTNTDYKTP